MHKRPLAVIVIFFIIGILLGEFFQSYITLIQVFCAFLFFLFFTITFTFTRKIWVSYIFLFLSIISVGALLYLNSNIFPPNHVSHFLGKDKVKAEIIGVIKSPAEARGIYYGKISSRYIFEIESIDNLKINGLALIRIQTEKDYQYGDRLLVKGSIRKTVLCVNGIHNKRVQILSLEMLHQEWKFKKQHYRKEWSDFVTDKATGMVIEIL